MMITTTTNTLTLPMSVIIKHLLKQKATITSANTPNADIILTPTNNYIAAMKLKQTAKYGAKLIGVHTHNSTSTAHFEKNGKYDAIIYLTEEMKEASLNPTSNKIVLHAPVAKVSKTTPVTEKTFNLLYGSAKLTTPIVRNLAEQAPDEEFMLVDTDIYVPNSINNITVISSSELNEYHRDLKSIFFLENSKFWTKPMMEAVSNNTQILSYPGNTLLQNVLGKALLTVPTSSSSKKLASIYQEGFDIKTLSLKAQELSRKHQSGLREITKYYKSL